MNKNTVDIICTRHHYRWSVRYGATVKSEITRGAWIDAIVVLVALGALFAGVSG